MPTTTASAAPASTPRRPGSASGLRVTPCISAPARPRAAPTPRPSSVRGTRSSRTIRWSVDPFVVHQRVPHRAERDRLGAEGDRRQHHEAEHRRRHDQATGLGPAAGQQRPPPGRGGRDGVGGRRRRGVAGRVDEGGHRVAATGGTVGFSVAVGEGHHNIAVRVAEQELDGQGGRARGVMPTPRRTVIGPGLCIVPGWRRCRARLPSRPQGPLTTTSASWPASWSRSRRAGASARRPTSSA